MCVGDVRRLVVRAREEAECGEAGRKGEGGGGFEREIQIESHRKDRERQRERQRERERERQRETERERERDCVCVCVCVFVCVCARSRRRKPRKCIERQLKPPMHHRHTPLHSHALSHPRRATTCWRRLTGKRVLPSQRVRPLRPSHLGSDWQGLKCDSKSQLIVPHVSSHSLARALTHSLSSKPHQCQHSLTHPLIHSQVSPNKCVPCVNKSCFLQFSGPHVTTSSSS
jgi:hypothetical protein